MENFIENFIKLSMLFLLLSTNFIDFYWLYNNFFIDGPNEPNESNKNTNKTLEETDKKPSIRYEDKYIDAIRSLSKEYIFSDEETEEIAKLSTDFITNKVTEYKEQINQLQEQVKNIEAELLKLSGLTDEDFIEIIADNVDDTNTIDLDKDEYIIDKQYSLEKLKQEIIKLEQENNIETITTESYEYAKNKIIEKRIDKLSSSFIMEYTPLGNVLMIYNKKKQSFSYYSDNTIPYRYLEVVARKFVKTFRCRQLFVDMEEEIQNIKAQMEEKRQEEERKQEAEKKQEEENKQQDKKEKEKEQKKPVFAKLKTYNKHSGRVNSAPPPKSSIPNNITTNNSNTSFILKENSNRYTYEGKISTFNILKKVDKKATNKKYGMTFADFKRLQK